MSTLPQLIAHRATAGARYVAAVAELRASFGDLAAIERLLESQAGTTPTFGGSRPDPVPLRHPYFLPDLSGSFEDDVVAAFMSRSRNCGKPDPL